MKVLLTGGAGFIGSWLAEAYLREGAQVVILDDMFSGREENIPAGAIMERMDVRDPDLGRLFRIHGFDVVNHHAARADVRDAVRDPFPYADVNIRGGINLLECCKRHPVKAFLFPSSGGCSYGEAQYVPTDEDHPLKPEDPYGTSKVCFEFYLRTYNFLYSLPYTIFRYPNVYGPRQNPFGEGGVIGIFAKKMLKNEEIQIFGDGEQQRDFVYIDDVVAANLLATRSCLNRTFNLGWGDGVTVNRIFALLKDALDYAHDPVYMPPRLGEIQRSILGHGQIAAKLGWQPQVVLEEGIRRTAEHIRRWEI